MGDRSLIGQAELPSAALVGATRCPQHACVKPADLGSPGTRATRSFRRRSCRLDCRDPIAQPIPSAVHSAVHTHRTVATLLLPIRASVRVRRCVCTSPCIECDMSGHARMCSSTRACVHSCSCAHGATAQRPNGSQGYSAVLLSGTTDLTTRCSTSGVALGFADSNTACLPAPLMHAHSPVRSIVIAQSQIISGSAHFCISNLAVAISIGEIKELLQPHNHAGCISQQRRHRHVRAGSSTEWMQRARLGGRARTARPVEAEPCDRLSDWSSSRRA